VTRTFSLILESNFKLLNESAHYALAMCMNLKKYYLVMVFLLIVVSLFICSQLLNIKRGICRKYNLLMKCF